MKQISNHYMFELILIKIDPIVHLIAHAPNKMESTVFIIFFRLYYNIQYSVWKLNIAYSEAIKCNRLINKMFKALSGSVG